jgi:hypothetical protein
MDDTVKAALAKWPNVPDCYGWLALDARGDWFMRDDRTQTLGAFPAVKGSRIEHDKLKAFICRNYAADARGWWYFQNGPQRVYVELEAAPLIWRLHDDGLGQRRLVSHTQAASIDAAAVAVLSVDEVGRLYAATAQGLMGLVHTQDMHLAADWIEQQHWPAPEATTLAELTQRCGYARSPQALHLGSAAKQPHPKLAGA